MIQANQIQYGGTHYKDRKIEPWDYIAANGIGYFEGNAIKYLTRWRDKGGVEDLKKARHYIDKLIELEEPGDTPDVAKGRFLPIDSLPESSWRDAPRDAVSVGLLCRVRNKKSDPWLYGMCVAYINGNDFSKWQVDTDSTRCYFECQVLNW